MDDIKCDRGEFLGGRRIDSATYLIRKGGDYTLPSIQVEWWDLANRKPRTASVPRIHFEAASDPGYRPDIPPETPPPTAQASPASGSRKHLSLPGGPLLVWAILHLGPIIVHRWIAWRRFRENSEAAWFHDLPRACKTGDPELTYRLLPGWVARFRPGVPLEEFLREAGDSELASAVNSVAAVLSGNSGTSAWSGSRLASALRRTRLSSSAKGRRSSRLPPLNP